MYILLILIYKFLTPVLAVYVYFLCIFIPFFQVILNAFMSNVQSVLSSHILWTRTSRMISITYIVHPYCISPVKVVQYLCFLRLLLITRVVDKHCRQRHDDTHACRRYSHNLWSQALCLSGEGIESLSTTPLLCTVLVSDI